MEQTTKRNLMISQLYRAVCVWMALLVLVLAVPAESAGTAPAQAASDPFMVALPVVMRSWFEAGPHFPLGYGPYRKGQSPTGAQPSAEQISEDLGLLKQETALIR